MVMGLRSFLEGFVVTVHEGMCETGFDVLFVQARKHCDNKPQQISLNHDYNMTVSISPCDVSILHLNYDYDTQSESSFACYSIVMSHDAH